MEKKQTNREQQIYKATFIVFFVNLFLSAGKLLAGIFGNSGAMIADAVHSLSDVVTDIIVLIFVRISVKPRDETHDYGHGKYETLATVVVGFFLAIVGLFILVKSVEKIIDIVNGDIIVQPEFIALLVAAVSIITKEILFKYTISVGKTTNSPATVANAWHHRSDSLTSIGTFVGIGCAYLFGNKWVILDPLAAVIVSGFILKVAYDLFMPGIDELLESSLPISVENEIIDIVSRDPLVKNPHNLKTRKIGANIAIEIHIKIPSETTVAVAHKKTEIIEHDLRVKYGEKTQVIVHVEPLDEME